ncbi:GNAT family N-acetyltransferase [Mycolicibacterium brisbanense]|uniref:GNAT family N-acetyltransferase n=1 Tax=Mycolicibacterium brisbanense TaxID=146020 RepID=UPI0013F4F11A|nr:GNAT family N-acetyltransferase [Mycolicibacterium brisbanense]MCV7160994.1 GNAT family N-acetyltransferase [Mycolicibacterium brisbanense]
MPDDAQRRSSTAAFYARFVAACWPHGGVYAADQGLGAALWLPPGRQVVTAEEAQTFNEALLATAGGDAARARMTQLFQMIDEHHPADVCWYLAFMGVEPAAQRRGIGSRLLAAVLAKADREKLPAYLEASSPENRRLYERHGFQTVGELTIAGSPTIFPMWRLPA